MAAEDPDKASGERTSSPGGVTSGPGVEVSTSIKGMAGRNYAWAFAGAILAGVVAVGGTQHPFPALLVMTVYLLYGLATAKREGVIIEFSDSFYYLGFTLTLLSLAFNLGSVRGFFRPGPTPDKLAAFGQAILTTIFGVIGRIWMQLFYRTTQESIEELNRRIGQVSREYLGDLEDISARAVRLRAKVLVGIEDLLTRSASESGKALGSISQNLQRTTEAAKTCAEAAEAGTKAMTEAVKAAKDLGTRMNQQFEGAGQIIRQATAETEGAVTAMTKHVQRLDESAIASLRASLRSVVTESKEMNKALTEQVNHLRTNGLTDLAASMREMSAQIRELDKIFRGQVDQFRSNGLTVLAASVGEVSKQIQQMDVVIGDIAEVVRKRLREL
jgi:hypothetical protein